ncbi:MAG: B12-binding domain-containing radical SAM protein [Desulfobacteraceae bacterium]|nr:MAG: B12-binding domain-containing radical SAM protein [Desulfobacteraceae bacterium]
MKSALKIHPRGGEARVLLSSVFGPYARDDEFGSRKINPMELYQNQVTRVQGAFSLRLFHRSFGLMFIQRNIKAPCTLLDFPSLDRFIDECRNQDYDIVGISSIVPNVGKVKKMCEIIRQYLPSAVIVVGGHIANKAGLEEEIDADHIVRGDGVRWFREFLGQNPEQPVLHPFAESAHRGRILGHNLSEKPGDTAAVLIPSVGCPVGCNFCSTSALFGGKGNFINFYETGDELFQVMCDIEKEMKVRSFFVLDENFLLHRKRALRLLDLMKEHNKSWMLNIFSSARVIQSYSMEEIVGLGIGWIWMGIEGSASRYRKLKDIDTMALVRTLQSHGIRVLGSSIIGLENHTPENIGAAIDYAVGHNTDFHQFMLYTPNPGTPLYEKHKKDGTLYDESVFPVADAHGQYRFNFRHRNILDGREEKYLLDAFEKDFTVNGPSLLRLIRTLLNGWKRYKNHPDRRIRDRFTWEVSPLRSTYAGAVWAMKQYFRKDRNTEQKLSSLLKDMYLEFGWKTRMLARITGMYIFISIKREERLLARGKTWEPNIYYEKNEAALRMEKKSQQFRVTRNAGSGTLVAAHAPAKI